MKSSERVTLIISPILDLDWLEHGFGLRDSFPLTGPLTGITTAQQIHSARVLDACGRKGERIGEGDAIVSAEAGVAIGVRTADCVPILMADPETRMVACVHAGWRGTAENIVDAAVRTQVARGCRPADLRVAIGPSIGSCCYEVGAEVASRFERWLPGATAGGRLALDLPAINEIQLLEAGVREIWKSGECTYCRPERFFSFRRDKENPGRMLSFVSRVV
jgi:polyphenol oxidase